MSSYGVIRPQWVKILYSSYDLFDIMGMSHGREYVLTAWKVDAKDKK